MNDRMPDETPWQPRPDRAVEPAPDAAPPRPANETRQASDTPAATPGDIAMPKSTNVDPLATIDESPEAAQRARAESAEADAGAVPPLTPAGYRMVRKLGHGTFGEVWLAEQEFRGAQADQNRILVAIKFFPGRDRAQLQRMLDEAKILTRLRSDPRIVYLIDHDADGAMPFFVIDFMEKGSLADQLKDGKTIPVSKARRLFREIVEAMAHVHAKGIRHCDLKPGNILINADGKPKVADFGQAHLSLAPTDLALGTFFYMAPDQANAEHQVPDSGWDVYGLGALFFAMVTGKPPRYDKHFADTLANTASMTTKLAQYRKWVQESPTPTEHRKLPGMDRALADIIDRCIAAAPANRFRDAGDVLAALERRARQRRQKPFLILAGAVFLTMTLLMGVFGFIAVQYSQDDLEKRVLDSNLITANLVANVVKDNLRYEMTRLETWANRPDLRSDSLDLERAKDPEKRKKLQQQLIEFSRTSRFNSLNIFDRKGALQVAVDRTKQSNPNAPPSQFEFDFSEKNYGQNYSWRNYWNRKKDYYEQRGRAEKDKDFFPFGPNQQEGKEVPFLGQPFVSTALSKYVAITISIPLDNPSNPKEMIGLLMGSINLSDLHRWIDPVEEMDGCAVLIDGHGYCLHHQKAHREKLEPTEKQAPEKKDFNLQAFLPLHGRNTEHRDPITGQVNLAVHIPIKEYGWDVIVQHERALVMAETNEIRFWLLVFLCKVVVVAALILAGLWWGFSWFEQRKQLAAQA